MDDNPGTLGTAAIILLSVLVYAVCIFTGACNVSDADSLRTLQHEGVSNVQLHGYAWFECDSKDTFATAFQGVKNGVPVEGALCAGWLKGITVRYK